MRDTTLQRIVEGMKLLPIDDTFRAIKSDEIGHELDSKYKYRSECGNLIYSPEFLLSKYGGE